MSTIASRVWTNYHLDTVHEDHPLRLLCAEARRLEAELEQMRELARQNGRERDALRALLAEARCALSEVRAHMHAAGRRPEECYEMSVIDDALRSE